jgi:Ca-activated chloride channel homolog
LTFVLPSPLSDSYRREVTPGRTRTLSKTLLVKFMPALRIRASSVVAMLATSLVWSPPVAGQQQTFRAGVNTVPIYATVTDARGALVTSLGPNDFLVEDDGRSREITLFQSGVQPMSIAILVDGSPSLFDVTSRLHDAVTKFVGHLLPADVACLGTFSQVVSLSPRLTSDHDALIRHLGDDMPIPAGTALWDAIEAGRAALESQGGRRVVLVFTDASDNSSVADVSLLRTRLERQGLLVYGVGLRGREGLPASEVSAMARVTGGWYVELRPADNVDAAIARIADELHRQYVIGFSPRSLDDRLHRISVKVASTRGSLTVRARRSYFASSRADVR